MNTMEIRDMIRKPLQAGDCSLQTMVSSLEIVLKDLKALQIVQASEKSVERDKSRLHQYMPDDRFTAGRGDK